MKTSQNLKFAGVSVLFLAVLAACNKPGPAERAGENIDRSVNMVGEKISNTADKVGDKMSQQSEKAGVAIEDTEITAKIKAAIFAEPGLKTLQISVDTVRGVVTLSGTVTTKSNSDMAKALAGAVAGVKDVDNRLVIKPNK